ncbi:MAG: glucose-6-phosphate isomerase, partial [Acidimicrobiales bacterium]|nr:glucose-6-phosphate isomerase [Acidimicrobiales bacterium]
MPEEDAMTAAADSLPPDLDIRATEAWRELVQRYDAVREVDLRRLFADDPDRGTRLTATAGDLYLDYSKHRIDQDGLDALFAVARRARLEDWRAAMFEGRHVNATEGRAVLHVALRLPRDATLVVDGQDVVADVHRVLDRMGDVAERIRSGE